jgi:hypothetical protein
MASSISVFTDVKIVQTLKPATDAAGRTGDYVSLKGAARAYVKVHLDQGNAATVAISLVQATSAAGAGSKAITALMPIQSSLDLSAASGDVLTARAAAATYTTDAAVKPKLVIIEIDPLFALDVANGFVYIAAVTGASNLANVTEAEVILTGLRYHESPLQTART